LLVSLSYDLLFIALQMEGIADFGAAAKRVHLYAFWQDVLGGRPMVLAGASLGGAIAIDFAYEYPEAVERLVLIDGQAYIDGSGERY
jgi:pimeloyl-ACP methyl ester carboxylesterase